MNGVARIHSSINRDARRIVPLIPVLLAAALTSPARADDWVRMRSYP